jgi:hypothetical protein
MLFFQIDPKKKIGIRTHWAPIGMIIPYFPFLQTAGMDCPEKAEDFRLHSEDQTKDL